MEKSIWSGSTLKRRNVCSGALGVFLCSTLRLSANEPEELPTKRMSHLFGETEIPKDPTRIVALGWNCEDILIALGRPPIAMEFRGLFDSGILPWNEEALGESKPVVLQNGLADYEEIASLNPDLIIVLSEYLEFQESSYNRLQKIAPTIVHQSENVNFAWKEQTSFIGNAIGRQVEADHLIQKTEDFLNGLIETYPEAKGKTFFFGTYSSGSSDIGVYLPVDPRVAMLETLGMKIASGVQTLGEKNPNQWRTGISLENIDLLDSDVAIIGFGDGIETAVKSSPLLQQHRAIRDGHCVYIEDPALTWGSSALSVLSMPFAFETFFKRISASLRPE